MVLLPARPQWAWDHTFSTVVTANMIAFLSHIVVHIDPARVDVLRLDQVRRGGWGDGGRGAERDGERKREREKGASGVPVFKSLV